MKKAIDFLSGKKTYVIAIITALLAGWQALGHTVDPTVYTILAAAGFACVRHGISQL